MILPLDACFIYGQSQLSNERSKNLIIESDTTIYSSEIIIDQTIKIRSDKKIDYSFNTQPKSIFIKYQGLTDTLEISYRILDKNILYNKPFLDSTEMKTDMRFSVNANQDDDNYNSRRFIRSKKLEYSGNFSRGVAFGNAQDLVLNSNFNLQMRGDLGNGLNVRAAISDENIPIQPQGNTQVLQEFDKIFIEIQKDRTTLVAGDYELNRPDSYFMNYFKKLKGLSMKNETSLSNGWQVSNRGSFAVSRGKFRRQILNIQEGNQGPYRLEGANNEVFLQVLSGTEKVFADGRLLKRGENNDYVIDYNRAQIRFTPNTVISANLRIIIEFEYTVQTYLRSFYATESKISNDKWAFQFNFYNEQDSKNLSSNIEFDSTDIRILEEGGDAPIFRPSIFLPDPENIENQIRYQVSPQNFLVFSPTDTTNTVVANFSNLGETNGSYNIDIESSANGRVYKYVGEGLGSYDPVSQLIPPEQKQLMTLSSKYNFSDSTSVYLEGSMSRLDLNRFSTIDNDDNLGLGLNFQFNDIRSVGKNGHSTISTNSNIEYITQDFEALNPYRVPEFIRDWNIDIFDTKGHQLLHNTGLSFKRKAFYSNYIFSGFHDQKNYDGIKNYLELGYRDKLWDLNAIGNLLTSESTIEITSFFRPRLDFKRYFLDRKLTLGYYLEKERNQRNDINTGTLRDISRDYDLSRFYTEWKAEENLNLKIAYANRIDKKGIDDQFQKISESHNYEFGGRWDQRKNSVLNWNLILREFIVEDINPLEEKSGRTFIGLIDHKLKLLNGGLSLNTYYEANSGQEPRIEFQYIRVQDGEGTYQWIDYNQDSIAQITEFEIANFSDRGDYEKVSVFNDEFISTNRNVLNQSLKIVPIKFIKKKKHILRKLQYNGRFKIDQKALSSQQSGFIQPINFNWRDTSLVAFNSSFDNSIFINRGEPKFDAQLSYRVLNNKFVQVSGYEQRLTSNYFLRSRINIQKSLDIILESNVGEKENDHEFSDNRDFKIAFWSLIPQINYRPNRSTRIVLKYRREKNDNLTGIEKSNINDLGIEFTWRNSVKSNLLFTFNLVDINYEGEKNTPVEFEMLRDLRDGQNYLWTINYTRRVSNNIDLIFNYNGRKSQDSMTIHNAGMQLRALF